MPKLYKVRVLNTGEVEMMTLDQLRDKFPEYVFQKLIVLKQFDRIVLEDRVLGTVRIRKVSEDE